MWPAFLHFLLREIKDIFRTDYLENRFFLKNHLEFLTSLENGLHNTFFRKMLRAFASRFLVHFKNSVPLDDLFYHLYSPFITISCLLNNKPFI